jgi:hypothetical protein
MRLAFILLILTTIYLSCKNNSKTIDPQKKNIKTASSKSKSFLDSLLVDTPKFLKAGRDYITRAPSPFDKVYFGNKFAPNKLEPYEIRELEKVLDSLIIDQKQVGHFKNGLLAFKYEIISVITSNRNEQAKIQAICNESAEGAIGVLGILKRWMVVIAISISFMIFLSKKSFHSILMKIFNFKCSLKSPIEFLQYKSATQQTMIVVPQPAT